MNIHEATAETALEAISDLELRRSVGTLFANAQSAVDTGRVNLVILTARRLACLYQLLVKAGMPPIEGCLVTSDRFLDTNPDIDWMSSSVLLLDDSVVVGTTLVRLHDDLVRAGVEAIFCRSVCVDIEQCATYLLDGADFSALCDRSSDDVQTFSREVVVALFSHKVPFFSDFPVTRPIEFSPKTWNTFLSDGDWHVADVTAPLLEGVGVQALAHVPTSDTFDRLLSKVPPEASSLIDSFKFRSFLSRSKQGVHVVIVPIAVLSPCTPAALNQALSSIGEHLRGSQNRYGFDWNAWKDESKHRLVQIYLSACVLAEVWPNVASCSGQGDSPLGGEHLEQLPIELYFGPLAPKVVDAFRSVVQRYLATEPGDFSPLPRIRLDQPRPSPLLNDNAVQDVLWEERELIAYTGTPKEPSRGELTKIGLIFAHAVSSIFGFLNRTYELPQRAQIKGLSTRANYDEEFGDGEKRFLNQGFTSRELTAALLPGQDESPWARSLMSLGIDVGNDLGIIVPVTRYDAVRDVVYRSYRLGETAQLAEWPLPHAVRTKRFDALSECVTRGFPIISSSEPIRTRWIRRWHGTTKESLDTLALAVHEAVPGKITSRFNGTVIAVDAESFDADLVSTQEDDHRVAQMRRDQLSDVEQRRLEPGAVFTWTVFAKERNGIKDNISRVRVRRSIPLNSDRQLQRAEALIYLAQTNLEGSDSG